MSKEPILDEKVIKQRKPGPREQSKEGPKEAGAALSTLQQTVGNRAVQRLLAQRSGEGAFDLDDDMATRINQQRGGGQALDSTIQASMGVTTGHDFSGVKVHTDAESHALNEQLSAKAFTTGQDIFFREGAYSPGSSGGQELLAHELTHVAQQGAGRVDNEGGKMTVNAPGDAFEQEADAVAKTVSSPGAGANVQLQEVPEEEEVQTQPEEEEEEEEVQMQEEDEEEVQMQAAPEEEEEI